MKFHLVVRVGAVGFCLFALVGCPEHVKFCVGNEDCNNHGTCDDTGEKCQCHTGYTGERCKDCAADYKPEDGECVPVEFSKQRLNITAGSGTASSTSYRVQLHLGAPQPYGTTSGSGKRLIVGPRPMP